MIAVPRKEMIYIGEYENKQIMNTFCADMFIVLR